MSNTSLTVGEQKQLASYEERIQCGMTAFVDVGQALIAIRDKKLYSDYDTFEEYCKKRWNFSRPRAYQLIESAKVVEVVSTMVDTPAPDNERQTRELAKLDTPQKQADAWAKVVETAPRDDDGSLKITAKHVAKVVKQLAPQAPGKPKPAPEKKPEPVEEGGAEPQEAIKPLDKMDALLTKIMEQQAAIERLLGKDDSLVSQIHSGLDSAFRGMTKLRAKLRKAG